MDKLIGSELFLLCGHPKVALFLQHENFCVSLVGIKGSSYE